MKPFWACTKNKEKYQVPSRNNFQRMSENDSTKIILSGNVTVGKDVRPCVECINGYLSQRNDLEPNIVHIGKSTYDRNPRFPQKHLHNNVALLSYA